MSVHYLSVQSCPGVRERSTPTRVSGLPGKNRKVNNEIGSPLISGTLPLLGSGGDSGSRSAGSEMGIRGISDGKSRWAKCLCTWQGEVGWMAQGCSVEYDLIQHFKKAFFVKILSNVKTYLSSIVNTLHRYDCIHDNSQKSKAWETNSRLLCLW